MLFTFFTLSMYAAPNTEEQEAKTKTEKYIRFVYDKLSFKKMQKLSFEAFSKGFYGYLNLKEAGKAHGNALLTICDFSLSSNLNRMWVIDLEKKKVMINSLVAHGMGSGEEFATKFSNIQDSHQSSLGFYTTGETYMGDNGYSLKLNGVDGAFNSNAYDRAIVVHGADYVCKSFACENNRLGRSHGCPALPRETSQMIIDKIKNGSVLFIYHPNKAYLKSSYWLTSKITHLPDEADYIDLFEPKNTNPKWVEMVSGNDSMAAANRIVIMKDTNSKSFTIIKGNNTTPIKPIISASNTANTSKTNSTSTSTTVPAVKDHDFLYIK